MCCVGFRVNSRPSMRPWRTLVKSMLFRLLYRPPKAAGYSLPRPSREWYRLVLDDGEWDVRFQYLGAPAMRTNSTEVAHVVWNTMFCCLTVAGIVLEDFHPAQNAASHPKWAEMQRLLKYFRGAIMSDPYRLQAAVDLEVLTLPAGPPWPRSIGWQPSCPRQTVQPSSGGRMTTCQMLFVHNSSGSAWC